MELKCDVVGSELDEAVEGLVVRLWLKLLLLLDEEEEEGGELITGVLWSRNLSSITNSHMEKQKKSRNFGKLPI